MNRYLQNLIHVSHLNKNRAVFVTPVTFYSRSEIRSFLFGRQEATDYAPSSLFISQLLLPELISLCYVDSSRKDPSVDTLA